MSIDFNTWLQRHPCTKQELWKIQNMLDDCLPDSQLHKDAVKAWRDMPSPPDPL